MQLFTDSITNTDVSVNCICGEKCWVDHGYDRVVNNNFYTYGQNWNDLEMIVVLKD